MLCRTSGDKSLNAQKQCHRCEAGANLAIDVICVGRTRRDGPPTELSLEGLVGWTVHRRGVSVVNSGCVCVSIEQRQQGRLQCSVCVCFTASWTSYPGEACARGGLLSLSLCLSGAVCEGSMLGLLQ